VNLASMPESNPGAELLSARFHIVLSPHYDDMALSIGATMATVADAGREVLDLIVFGTDPAGVPLTEFARHHHEAWGVSASEAIAARKREEATAVAILGTTTGNLPFHDAIYRGDSYTSDEVLFGAPAGAEASLPGAIADAAVMVARSLAGPAHRPDDGLVRFYAPIGIGRHVDHQLVFRAAKILARTGYDVWLFEDLPYAMIGSNLSARLSEVVADGSDVRLAAAVDALPGWSRKIRAVLAYPSQLETVFSNYAGVEATGSAIDEALVAYHVGIGKGERVERFWRFTTAEPPGS
jgi:LmbE family N-acetylglucosaminyl deacetylase